MGPRLGSLWSQEAPLMSVSGSLKNLLGLLRSGSKYGWLNYFYSSTTSVVSCRVVSVECWQHSLAFVLFLFTASMYPGIYKLPSLTTKEEFVKFLDYYHYCIYIVLGSIFVSFTIGVPFFFKVFSLFTRYFFYWGGPNLDENIYLLKKTFSQNLFIGMLRKKKCINIPINFN